MYGLNSEWLFFRFAKFLLPLILLTGTFPSCFLDGLPLTVVLASHKVLICCLDGLTLNFFLRSGLGILRLFDARWSDSIFMTTVSLSLLLPCPDLACLDVSGASFANLVFLAL